ncbi:MAG: hypothetical protein HGA71_09095 [Azonexaceae bacterium]|nr:hypothetical protein [Azonexaceae bacterium]
MRRQCGTCEQWQGERRIVLDRKGNNAVAANRLGGNCRDGAWQDFSTLPRQTCDQYQRWKALLDEPSDPVVLSAISQLHREIRMQSHLAEPLPEKIREKLDELLWEIECWHIRRHFVDESREEPEMECFFNEYVTGLFDCFYYFGWSSRKPVSEMSLEDFWPLR